MDTDAVLQSLLRTEIFCETITGIERASLDKVHLVGQPPELKTIHLDFLKPEPFEDIGLVSSIHAKYGIDANVTGIDSIVSMYPRENFVVDATGTIHCLYDPLPPGISLEFELTRDTLPYKRLQRYGILDKRDDIGDGIYLTKFISDHEFGLFLDRSRANVDQFFDLFPHLEIRRYFNHYLLIHQTLRPLHLIVGDSLNDYFQNHCLINMDLCFWELSQPYYIMDSLASKRTIYWLDTVYEARSRLYEALVASFRYSLYHVHRSLLRDLRIMRLLWENREYMELVKWNYMVQRLQYPDFPLFLFVVGAYVTSLEDEVFVFRDYHDQNGIYKYQAVATEENQYFQLDPAGNNSDATSSADGYVYNTLLADMSHPDESKQEMEEREQLFNELLMVPNPEPPEYQLYRERLIASPQRKRTRR